MKKSISLLLAIVCLITLLSTSFTASATTANVKVSEVSKVTIQNLGTGQYLNFDYGTLKNGNSVRVWPWDGSKDQLWSIDCVSGSTYRILTYKSAKYCLDVYRGNKKLKSGQKCDIWKTGDDTIAQNITFYLCNDGSYIIRMANNSNLALTSTTSKSCVKLASFNASSKSQKWIFKDAKGNKIDIKNNKKVSESNKKTVQTSKKSVIPAELENVVSKAKKKYKQGKSYPYLYELKASQCHGFAVYMADLAFNSDKATETNEKYNFIKATAKDGKVDQIRPGDILRAQFYGCGHSIFVLGVDSKYIYYADCNADGKCTVNYEQKIKRTELEEKMKKRITSSDEISRYGYIFHYKKSKF